MNLFGIPLRAKIVFSYSFILDLAPKMKWIPGIDPLSGHALVLGWTQIKIWFLHFLYPETGFFKKIQGTHSLRNLVLKSGHVVPSLRLRSIFKKPDWEARPLLLCSYFWKNPSDKKKYFTPKLMFYFSLFFCVPVPGTCFEADGVDGGSFSPPHLCKRPHLPSTR